MITRWTLVNEMITRWTLVNDILTEWTLVNGMLTRWTLMNDTLTRWTLMNDTLTRWTLVNGMLTGWLPKLGVPYRLTQCELRHSRGSRLRISLVSHLVEIDRFGVDREVIRHRCNSSLLTSSHAAHHVLPGIDADRGTVDLWDVQCKLRHTWRYERLPSFDRHLVDERGRGRVECLVVCTGGVALPLAVVREIHCVSSRLEFGEKYSDADEISQSAQEVVRNRMVCVSIIAYRDGTHKDMMIGIVTRAQQLLLELLEVQTIMHVAKS
jgi:hypothetical protein